MNLFSSRNLSETEVGGAELPPPLFHDPYTPLEHYLKVRELFGISRENPKYLPSLDSALAHPFTVLSLPALTLKYWRAWDLGTGVKLPPFPFASAAIPCAHQLQLALLWTAMGEKTGEATWQEAANVLAVKWVPLLQKGLFTLGSSEREYGEEEHQLSSDLLLQKEVGPLADPFFAFLSKIRPPLIVPATLGSGGKSALAYSPSPPQVGAFRHGSILIPAFGPQGPLLSDATLFGANLVERGWHQPTASKETWFHLQERELGFSVQSIGAPLETPLFWVFYIRAEECEVGTQRFRPQHLQRFQGEAVEVSIRAGTDEIILQADHPMQAQLIPLAGKGCFWESSFLLAFQWPAVSGSFGFRFASSKK